MLNCDIQTEEATRKGHSIMKSTTPVGEEIGTGRRHPFHEVSVLFPLLSFYTASYLGLMIADFWLMRSLNLPDGLMSI